MRKMNKSDRQMTLDDTKMALANGDNGTLSVNGDNGYPYSVPVNYIYENDRIYIHCAKYGYKVDMIERDNKVCFSSIISSKIVQNKFTSAYQSVVATGKIRVVDDENEKLDVLKSFIYKLSPDFVENGMKFVKSAKDKTLLYAIDIENITGKANLTAELDVK